MNEPTRDEVIKSVEPSSAQINADDLIAGPITVTIEKVSRGDREQPIHIGLVGYEGKTYRPCKTMRRIMIAAFSDDPKQWVGQQMTIYCDPDVLYAGVRVGGIRISHLSGLAEPRPFMLTKSRGKRAEVTIYPIVKLSPEDQKFISEATKELTGAESLDVLNGYGEILKAKPKSVQDALRPIYVKRLNELKSKEALA